MGHRIVIVCLVLDLLIYRLMDFVVDVHLLVVYVLEINVVSVFLDIICIMEIVLILVPVKLIRVGKHA